MELEKSQFTVFEVIPLVEESEEREQDIRKYVELVEAKYKNTLVVTCCKELLSIDLLARLCREEEKDDYCLDRDRKCRKTIQTKKQPYLFVKMEFGSWSCMKDWMEAHIIQESISRYDSYEYLPKWNNYDGCFRLNTRRKNDSLFLDEFDVISKLGDGAFGAVFQVIEKPPMEDVHILL